LTRKEAPFTREAVVAKIHEVQVREKLRPNSNSLVSSVSFRTMADKPYEESHKCTWSLGASGQKSAHSHETLKPRAKILDTVLDAIGHTPMVRLNRVGKSDGVKCEICTFRINKQQLVAVIKISLPCLLLAINMLI